MMCERLNQITKRDVTIELCYRTLGESAFEHVNTTEKELVLFEHSGHSPMDTESDLFVEEVLEFVVAYR